MATEMYLEQTSWHILFIVQYLSGLFSTQMAISSKIKKKKKTTTTQNNYFWILWLNQDAMQLGNHRPSMQSNILIAEC